MRLTAADSFFFLRGRAVRERARLSKTQSEEKHFFEKNATPLPHIFPSAAFPLSKEQVALDSTRFRSLRVRFSSSSLTMRLTTSCQPRTAVASTSSCCSSSLSSSLFTDARSSRRVSSPGPRDFCLSRSPQHGRRSDSSRGSTLRTNALQEAAAIVVESSSAAASMMATTSFTTAAEFVSYSYSSSSNAVFELASSMFKIPGATSRLEERARNRAIRQRGSKTSNVFDLSRALVAQQPPFLPL